MTCSGAHRRAEPQEYRSCSGFHEVGRAGECASMCLCVVPWSVWLSFWNGAPGGTLACNLRVRSAVLSTLSYGSVRAWWASWIARSFVQKIGSAEISEPVGNCTLLSRLKDGCFAAKASSSK